MSSFINDLDAEQFLIFANFLAISFSKGMTAEEINNYSLLFTALGDLMAIIAAKQEEIESNSATKGEKA